MSMRIPAIALCGVVLASCASTTPDVGAPVDPSQATATATGTTEGATPQLIRDANLLPCPPSDATGAPAPNGLPDVTMPCLGKGPSVRLSGVRGKPMVVPVWASWCIPCRTELPIIGEVARSSGNKVQYLGIDLADSADAALKMAAQTHMTIASVQDPEMTVRSALRIVGPPVTLFVDSSGTVVGRSSGSYKDAAALRADIAKYLNVTVP